MSVDPTVLQTLLDAHKALAGNIKQLPPQPHILSLSPSERAEFKGTVEQANNSLANLTAQLASVRAGLDAILANEVRRSMAQLSLCVAPIGYLPADLFRSITRRVVELHSLLERPKSVRILLAVSTTWRDIVLSDPFLFTFIDWRGWNANLISLWRSRAKDLPLSITLDARWQNLINGVISGVHHTTLDQPFSQEEQSSEGTVHYHQRLKVRRQAQHALLDELAAALCNNCRTLHLDIVSHDFQSWIGQRNIVLSGVETLALRVPATKAITIDVEWLPNLRRLDAACPLSYSCHNCLTALSLTVSGGKWSDYAATFSNLEALESLRIRFGPNTCQVDSSPTITLSKLKTFQLSNCWSDRFVRTVLPVLHAPNVRELVLEDTRYFDKAWWRTWTETFPAVTRLVISDDGRHMFAGFQRSTSLQRLFRKSQFPALSEIHIIAEFGAGALVGVVSTLIGSYPASVNNEGHQIRCLSLPPLSRRSISSFWEDIEQARTTLRLWDKWWKTEGRDPQDPSSILEWKEYLSRRLQLHEYQRLLAFDSVGYLDSLESWLILSESIENFQVVEPDLDHHDLLAMSLQEAGNSTRSNNAIAARQLVQETLISLQRELFDSGLSGRVDEMRQLLRSRQGFSGDVGMSDGADSDSSEDNTLEPL
ncbi:hypothetical protein DL93DRAFT_2077779 [Clavulina sp. PMI_390]|nr:hypothetical protein DL93DRAFT_2077779 [Clavulina sp. PMI_390]